jgi:AcrR family transcriptional regulator
MPVELNDAGMRRRPVQARSVATFDALLRSAAALLEERGVGAFSTNALAAESGLSVRAIYRYFPNKQAVIVELARQLSAGWLDAVSAVGDLGDPAVPWEPVWRGYLDAWVRAVVAEPGGSAIIAAMRDDPKLRVVDDEINERYVEGIAAALRRRRPSLTAEQGAIAAGVLMRSTIGVLDEAVAVSAQRRGQLIDALLTMHVHYLRHLLDEEAPDVDR